MPLEDAEGRGSEKGSARTTLFLDSLSFEAEEAVTSAETSAETNIQPVPQCLSRFLAVYETAGQGRHTFLPEGGFLGGEAVDRVASVGDEVEDEAAAPAHAGDSRRPEEVGSSCARAR
jgi:hypothetical protein